MVVAASHPRGHSKVSERPREASWRDMAVEDKPAEYVLSGTAKKWQFLWEDGFKKWFHGMGKR